MTVLFIAKKKSEALMKIVSSKEHGPRKQWKEQALGQREKFPNLVITLDDR